MDKGTVSTSPFCLIAVGKNRLGTILAVTIEVFADIWCPFAYVGLLMAREQRNNSSNPETALVIRAWPLELVNGKPQNAEATEHHAGDLRTQVAPQLFANVDASHFPTSSLEALALVARAYRQSSARGEEASFVLRHALFEEGADISNPAVLSALAVKLGVPAVEQQDRDQVQADWEEGQARGVVGSPHFFHGAESLFCPSLSISRDKNSRIHVSIEQERLRGFIDTCLAG